MNTTELVLLFFFFPHIHSGNGDLRSPLTAFPRAGAVPSRCPCRSPLTKPQPNLEDVERPEHTVLPHLWVESGCMEGEEALMSSPNKAGVATTAVEDLALLLVQSNQTEFGAGRKGFVQIPPGAFLALALNPPHPPLLGWRVPRCAPAFCRGTCSPALVCGGSQGEICTSPGSAGGS